MKIVFLWVDLELGWVLVMIGLEENLVLYCMGNRDYWVMDGM